MNDNKITTRPGSVTGRTVDALKSVLEDAGMNVSNAHIYLPHKRENGVYWIAIGTYCGQLIAVHGMSVAGTCVRNGMVITAGAVWQAVANSTRSRGKAAKIDYGNALAWPAEPMVDRIEKCIETIIGNGMTTEAFADKLRKKAADMKGGK